MHRRDIFHVQGTDLRSGPSRARREGESQAALGAWGGGCPSIFSSVTVGTLCSRVCSVLNASLCGSSISSAYMLLRQQNVDQVAIKVISPGTFRSLSSDEVVYPSRLMRQIS